ncbi:MAG: sel1 repeat family protein [Bacteroidales bacterium]|nr:sel1 repeat family protein [Bacteroidales bacterium]
MHRFLLSIICALTCACSAYCLNPEATDSLQRIADAAEKGDAAAQNTVGEWYYNGENFKQSYLKAIQWWLRAQKQDYPQASSNLARCYLNGHGVTADTTRAAGLMKRAIRLGDKEALAATVTAADSGCHWAAALMADIYNTGLGEGVNRIKANKALAAKYRQIAATGGDAASKLEYAMSLLNAKKFPEAIVEFTPLASAGNPSALFWTGKMRLEGLGIPMNKQIGLSLIKQAADSGMPMAHYYVGRSYAVGDGVDPDAKEAARWYKTGAQLGNHYAQYALARCLTDGTGVPANFGLALRMYERAAAHGHRTAFTRLVNDTIPDSPFAEYCRIRKLINGGSYDEALARLKEFKKIDKHEADTWQAVILSNRAYSGYNLNAAIKLLRSAAKGGNPEALCRLGGIYTDDNSSYIDVPGGIEMLKKASEAGNPEADMALGAIYCEGGVTPINEDLSREYFRRAAPFMPMPAAYREAYAELVADPAMQKEILSKSDQDLLPDMLKTVIVK